MAKLQSSEESWKKRVSKTDSILNPGVVKLRDKKSDTAVDRPKSIMDRLSKLNDAQQGWKNKVERDKDVEKLTVEGKMKSAGIFSCFLFGIILVDLSYIIDMAYCLIWGNCIVK